MKNENYNRRSFIKKTSLGVGTTLLSTSLMAGLPFPNLPFSGREKKTGVALVGLGNYAMGQLAPALQLTRNCYLAGLITGTPAKAEKYKEQYKIADKNIYNYQNFDAIAKNKEIEVVYVVLPNSMHAEYVIRAAKAGKHVICEKPLGLNAAECQEMIDVCKANNVSLSVGYRLHFDPFHQEVMKFGREKPLGEVKFIQSDFGFAIGDPDQWRLKKEMAGGGAIMDVGIYCVQAARYTTGMEPLAVTANTFSTGIEKLKEVDETTTFLLEFAGGIVSTTTTSYAGYINRHHVVAEEGAITLSPAFSYNGLKGDLNGEPLDFGKFNQQAAQLDAISMSIREGKDIGVSGEEALKDAKVIDAIYQSIAQRGKRIEI